MPTHVIERDLPGAGDLTRLPRFSGFGSDSWQTGSLRVICGRCATGQEAILHSAIHGHRSETGRCGILAGKRSCAFQNTSLIARIPYGRGTTNPRLLRYMAGGITTSASRLTFRDPANIIWNNSKCTSPPLRRVHVAFNGCASSPIAQCTP